MADLFDVIADPTRRELLRALLESSAAAGGTGESSVGELVGQLSLSQPTVSKHLKVLRDFSIVTVREQGQHRYYRLDPVRLEPIAEWLGAFVVPAAPVAAAAPEPEAAPAPLTQIETVATHAPTRPLPASVRSAAIRVGAAAASVVELVARARR